MADDLTTPATEPPAVEIELPVESAPEKPAEPEWFPPFEYPPDDRLVEAESCGELVKVRHVNGRWLPDGQDQGVNVKRWRLA